MRTSKNSGFRVDMQSSIFTLVLLLQGGVLQVDRALSIYMLLVFAP